MSDASQRQTDFEMGIHERRMMDRSRFGSPLAADLFAFGVEITRPFVPPPIRENDPTRLAAIADEVVSEGRVHRNTRPNRNE